MSMALDLASLWTRGLKPSYFEWMIKTTLFYMLTNTAYLHCREMAEATNFTEDVLQKIKKELSCSPQYNLKVDNELKILSAQNIFLSITAFLGNTLVLVALHREISLHPPSKLLYRNLAITDLCVGIIAETLAVIYWISVVNESWKICYYADLTATFTGNILCAVTLCTLTVKSVDRLFVLSLGIRYRDVVTLRRAKITVTVMWVLSIVGASSYFWNPVITLWYMCIGLSLCLAVPTYSYTKIFLSLRHNQVQVQGYGSDQGQPSQRVVQGRNSTLLVTGKGAGIGWASVVLVPLATIMLFPWTWENLFVEVSLASDGGRVQRVLSITCFQGQNDVYSAFTPSLSRSDTFPWTHSKSVHWWLCRKCSLYVSPYLVFNQSRGGK